MTEACKPAEVKISIPSNLEWLGLIDKIIIEMAAQVGLDERLANEIAISVVEAGTNAIVHGHRRDEDKPVDFQFELDPSHIRVVVSDCGPGFDVDRVLNWNPTSPEALLSPRGRGIFIMKRLMDEVSFRIVKGEGCWVTLVKRFDTPAS